MSTDFRFSQKRNKLLLISIEFIAKSSLFVQAVRPHYQKASWNDYTNRRLVLRILSVLPTKYQFIIPLVTPSFNYVSTDPHPRHITLHIEYCISFLFKPWAKLADF